MAAIFERHHQALHRYCHSIVGNSHDAADALQNTMIKALRALPGEQREIVLRPWLYRIAHNESISLLRARRPESDLDAAAHLSDPAAAGLLESRERLRSLTGDLGELTERQRGALLMRELGGLEFAEVAEALDSTPAAAKQSVYEARCALQDMQEGRDMSCETVRRALSDGDRRTLRGMRIRGHLRGCAGCREFETAMRHRPVALAAMIPPLPIAAATAMLHSVLGATGTHGGGGFAAGLAGTAKTATGLSLAAKAATVVAVSATLAGGAVYVAPQLQPAKPAHRAALPVTAASASPPARLAAARALRRLLSGASTGNRHATKSGARSRAAATLGGTLAPTTTGTLSSSSAAIAGPAPGTPGSGNTAVRGVFDGHTRLQQPRQRRLQQPGHDGSSDGHPRLQQPRHNGSSDGRPQAQHRSRARRPDRHARGQHPCRERSSAQPGWLRLHGRLRRYGWHARAARPRLCRSHWSAGQRPAREHRDAAGPPLTPSAAKSYLGAAPDEPGGSRARASPPAWPGGSERRSITCGRACPSSPSRCTDLPDGPRSCLRRKRGEDAESLPSLTRSVTMRRWRRGGARMRLRASPYRRAHATPIPSIRHTDRRTCRAGAVGTGLATRDSMSS